MGLGRGGESEGEEEEEEEEEGEEEEFIVQRILNKRFRKWNIWSNGKDTRIRKTRGNRKRTSTAQQNFHYTFSS